MQGNRPKYHFTPEKGWMNDPNGLIYIDGVYHMFYQHYPDSTQWGPMHWGHATSTDLLHWEHQPIALYPTEEEYIFSGSAVLDKENVSGLGDGKKAPLLLFYTSHNPKSDEEMQSIAYSLDYIHFEKYQGNPVITNRKEEVGYKPDFRDPKIFKNEIKGGYSMALAAGERVEFFHSMNLLTWEKTGAFTPGEFGIGGITECPDCFSLFCGEEKKTILSMSIIFWEKGKTEESKRMQYFVGRFDGGTFWNEQAFDEKQFLDFGRDNYAMVTFMDSPRPTAIGWGENWEDAKKNTRTDYFGKMTLARELSLEKSGSKYYIQQTPFFPAEENAVGKNTDEVWQKECAGVRVICDHGYYEIYSKKGVISFGTR